MNKKIIFVGVSITLMLLLMVGISYASWVDLKEQTGIDTINAGCFDVQISSESNNINLTSASLMTESVGKKQENPYTFTITNTCDVKAAYTIDLGVLTESDTDNALDPKFISVYLSGSGERLLGYLTTNDTFTEVTPTSSSYRDEYQLTTGVLGPSSDTSTSSVTYYLRMWINNDPDVTYSASEINGKTLRSKIIIKSSKTEEDPTIIEDTGKDIYITYDYNYLPNDIFGTVYNTNSYSINTGNLISYNKSSYNGLPSYTVTMTDTENNTPGFYFTPISEGLTNGTTYTFSFEAKASEELSAEIGSEQGGSRYFNLTTSWERYNCTFTVKESTYKAFVFYHWVQENETTLYIRNLQMQKGTLNTEEYSYIQNNTLGELPTPVRENYTFDGWYTDPIEGTKITSDTIATTDTTYYAHYTYNG